MTTALEGGEGSASRPGRSLPPAKTRYPLYRKLCGAQDRSGQVRKISPLPGFDPRTVQPVASSYTDYATRPTILHIPCIIPLIGHIHQQMHTIRFNAYISLRKLLHVSAPNVTNTRKHKHQRNKFFTHSLTIIRILSGLYCKTTRIHRISAKGNLKLGRILLRI